MKKLLSITKLSDGILQADCAISSVEDAEALTGALIAVMGRSAVVKAAVMYASHVCAKHPEEAKEIQSSVFVQKPNDDHAS